MAPQGCACEKPYGYKKRGIPISIPLLFHVKLDVTVHVSKRLQLDFNNKNIRNLHVFYLLRYQVLLPLK